MYRSMTMLLISAIGFSLSAQSVSLNGTVTNQSSGQPIAGATVKIAGKNISDTTDASGKYSIINTAMVTTVPTLTSTEVISMSNGIISFSLTGSAPVRFELFDMRGNLLERVFNHPASAGNYRFNAVSHPLATNMMVIRVSIGQRTSTFRYLPLNEGMLKIGASVAVSPALTKVQATIDSLKVTASGYTSKTVSITSYKGEVNITLDSSVSGTLDKFSFFITSLKALQELSGNAKGFGGDFSFGKTGQGAGLLGADSICQCIAEKSMPGSKVKQWRAFLSVKKGPDGTQVNAIDRIGKGPWYDRIGRVVSPDLAGLLAARPNADAAIKNDLPNEDGIPNHRPDPNLAQVDNHHMVTASGTDGKLSGETCSDWTSVSGTGPRCGFSWPRSSTSANHWISGFNASGCEPSIESQKMVGIGGGGGYGGFYCFALNP